MTLPGHRGSRPDARRRCGREHRHLRTHQGRGARRQIRAAAIQTGYTKGFATIVDANVVTMITALVLFAVATASVRGFALMLLVGTAISMLTAVVATRALLAVLAGMKLLDSPRVMGAAGGGIPRWLKLDYIGRRNTWFAISGVVVVIASARSRQGPEPRNRLQGWHADRVRDAHAGLARRGARTRRHGSAEASAQIQGRGTATGGDALSQLHRSHRVADGE